MEKVQFWFNHRRYTGTIIARYKNHVTVQTADGVRLRLDPWRVMPIGA